MALAVNAGTAGLEFNDFYTITCGNFWPYCSKNQAQQAFDQADVDPEDDFLSAGEFLTICVQFMDDNFPDDETTTAEQAFDDCDDDDNEIVESHEFEECFTNYCMSKCGTTWEGGYASSDCICTGLTAACVFDAYNTNGDGMEFAEFKEFYEDIENGSLKEMSCEEETDPNPDDGTTTVTSNDEFNEWIWGREVRKDDYSHCNMDIDVEWHNRYFLFVGHNCDIYDLSLKLFISKNDWESKKWITDDADEKECTEYDADTMCCEFFMKPENNKLGIAFDYPADGDWTYETTWSDCIDTTNPTTVESTM
jgi:hypothetical protein